MVGIYEQFQILMNDLNLPEQNIPSDITIISVSGRDDYNKLLDLFFKIFPDEVDSEKGMDLRDLPVQYLAGEGIYLAILNQEPVGFLVTGIINQVGYISYIGVLHNFQSRGIATALLKRFKQYLNENSVEKIRCKIREDNKKTLGYISYLGFKKI